MVSKFVLLAVVGVSAASYGVVSMVGGCPASAGSCGSQTVSATNPEKCAAEPVSVVAEPKHGDSCSTDGKASSCCGPKDLVAVISKHKDLSTLSGLLKSSGLDKELAGEKKFTIFAPTDAAFAKLPEATLDMLAKPENKSQLRAILLGHTVEGLSTSCCLTDGQVVKTVSGAELKVTVKDGKVTVGGATVVEPNVEAGNGLVHAVDTVILPVRG